MASVPDALKQAIEQHHSATNEFLKGNVLPWKETCSHRDDVTIIGGWGGYERGWIDQVEKRYEWAAARFAGGEVHFENISLVVTPELAYSVDIERSHARLSGEKDFVPMALRVTTIYRLEDGQWKVVHRHADPLLTVQPAVSAIQRGQSE
jgi:ketosteroid isomerase-like protein